MQTKGEEEYSTAVRIPTKRASLLITPNHSPSSIPFNLATSSNSLPTAALTIASPPGPIKSSASNPPEPVAPIADFWVRREEWEDRRGERVRRREARVAVREERDFRREETRKARGLVVSTVGEGTPREEEREEQEEERDWRWDFWEVQ